MNQQNITLINPTAELKAAFSAMAEEFFEEAISKMISSVLSPDFSRRFAERKPGLKTSRLIFEIASL